MSTSTRSPGSRALISSGSRSLLSTSSYPEIPSVPGLKRDVSTINPVLYKQYKKSLAKETLTLGRELEIRDDDQFLGTPLGDFSDSLMSYFETSQDFESFQKSTDRFPKPGSRYNDTNGRYSLKSQQRDRLTKTRSLPYSSLDSAPAFVVNANTVCKFTAYFTEMAMEKGREVEKSRIVEISYHTEDNTMEIVEPKVRNCGLLQGKVLKRHQVPKPTPYGTTTPNSAIFTLEDFTSGAKLQIYSRIYTVLNCDKATREMFDSAGLRFGDDIPAPENSYRFLSTAPEVPEDERVVESSSIFAKESPSKRAKGFYEYGKKVLRFYGVWDASDMLYGDKIMVRLYYYLSDDTVEIIADNSRNSGRDTASKLIKKTKIPKLENPNDIANVQNTITQDGNPLPTYLWSDLYIGLNLQVASVNIRILDADDFTREFYENRDMPLSPAILLPKIESTVSLAASDSAESSVGFNIGKLEEFKLKKVWNTGIILRFVATLHNPKPEDMNRKFIIQTYLEDDTIQIMEPPVRNSGFKGGVFLTRCPIVANNSQNQIVPTDLFVGVTISLLAHKFVVHDADEFTLKYMETHDFQWNQSNIKLIKEKLIDKDAVIKKILLTTRGLARKQVTRKELEDILLDPKLNLGLVKQEVITLHRSLDQDKVGTIPLTQILKLVQ